MEVNNRDDFERLKLLKEFRGLIRSDSMDPFLKVGDEISVEVGTKDLRRFDLIIFWRNNQMTCHCLWNINRYIKPVLIETRCIRYQDQEHPVGLDDYLGKVVSHKLSLRYRLQIMWKEKFS